MVVPISARFLAVRGIERALLFVPLLGRGLLELSISRFARCFGMLYKAGLPIDQCLDLAAGSAGTVLYPEIRAASEAVRMGQPTYIGLTGKVPAEYQDLWRIGEETGQLDRATEKISQLASERAELILTALARWIPRLIYLGVMGLVVSMIFRLAGQLGTAYESIIGNY
jgi:type IV pilus assembly protein PilC